MALVWRRHPFYVDLSRVECVMGFIWPPVTAWAVKPTFDRWRTRELQSLPDRADRKPGGVAGNRNAPLWVAELLPLSARASGVFAVERPTPAQKTAVNLFFKPVTVKTPNRLKELGTPRHHC